MEISYHLFSKKKKHFFVNNIFDMPIKTFLQLISIQRMNSQSLLYNIIYMNVRGHHRVRNMKKKMEKKKVITV